MWRHAGCLEKNIRRIVLVWIPSVLVVFVSVFGLCILLGASCEWTGWFVVIWMLATVVAVIVKVRSFFRWGAGT